MEVTTQVPGSQKMETIQNHFFSDLSVMLGRSMRHIFRSMDTIITVTITPIAMMVLFVYVFGGAIQTGTANYVNYLVPGILLIAIASGISYTAFRLFTDVQRGIIERFRSMPIAPSTLLWGHVLTSLVSNAISLVVIMLVALIMGFRSSAGILSWLAVVGILAVVDRNVVHPHRVLLRHLGDVGEAHRVAVIENLSASRPSGGRFGLGCAFRVETGVLVGVNRTPGAAIRRRFRLSGIERLAVRVSVIDHRATTVRTLGGAGIDR